MEHEVEATVAPSRSLDDSLSSSTLLDSLTRLAALRASMGPDSAAPQQLLEHECSLRTHELHFVERARCRSEPAARQAPRQAEGFVAWVRDMQATGPGQGDDLFPWLAEQATLEEFRWFVRQEVAGEAGFEDLVAKSLVRLPTQEKLELARNFWDEMGRGQERGMHGPMLERLAAAMRVQENTTPVLWEAQAVGFLMTALASNPWYVYESLGSLGAVELTAPGRASHINRGLKRLGYAGRDRMYFAVHASLDIKHADAWIREVFVPCVRRTPEAAPRLASGILMRMQVGADSYAAYRRILWAEEQHAIH